MGFHPEYEESNYEPPEIELARKHSSSVLKCAASLAERREQEQAIAHENHRKRQLAEERRKIEARLLEIDKELT